MTAVPTPPPAGRPDLDLDSFEELHRYCLEPCPSRDVLCYALAAERRAAEIQAELTAEQVQAIETFRAWKEHLAAAARENERLRAVESAAQRLMAARWSWVAAWDDTVTDPDAGEYRAARTALAAALAAEPREPGEAK